MAARYKGQFSTIMQKKSLRVTSKSFARSEQRDASPSDCLIVLNNYARMFYTTINYAVIDVSGAYKGE